MNKKCYAWYAYDCVCQENELVPTNLGKTQVQPYKLQNTCIVKISFACMIDKIHSYAHFKDKSTLVFECKVVSVWM